MTDSPDLPEGVVHLFSAHDVNQAGGMSLVAVCGEPVNDSGASCPPGCDCDHRYCAECVRAAIRWSPGLLMFPPR